MVGEVDPAARDRRMTRRIGLLVTALAVLAFLPALGCGFVIPDDNQNFQSNPAFDYPWGQKLAWAWTTRWMEVYQPLWWMVVMVQHAAWGFKPMGYHAVSLALHAAVAAAVFILTLTMLRWATAEPIEHAGATAGVAAGLATILFCVHPLRAEMVAWLSGQAHLPSVLCMIAGVWAYLRAHEADRSPRSRQGWLVGSFMLGSAAMFFKTSAVSFPFILLVLDWYPLRRLTLDADGATPARMRQAWWVLAEKTPLLALSGVMMVMSRWAKPLDSRFVSGDSITAPLSARLADAALVVWFYPYKTLMPTHLSAFYPRADASLVYLGEPSYAVCAAAIVATCALAWVMRRRCPGFTAAWAAYLIILAPNSGLVRFLPQFAADRYSYAASIPWAVLLAGGLAWLIRKCRWAVKVCWAIVGSLAMVLLVLSWYQTATWRDSVAVWDHALEAGNAKSVDAHVFLGDALFERGRGIEALEQYFAAVEIGPDSPCAQYSMAMGLVQVGNGDAAVHELREFARKRQNDPLAHYALGHVLMVLGKCDQATASLRESLRLDPGNYVAHSDLGVDLARLGDLEGAVAELQTAIRLRPDYPVLKANLDDFLADRGAELRRREAARSPVARSPSSNDVLRSPRKQSVDDRKPASY
jgi:protein O-mannosyl-transferase